MYRRSLRPLKTPRNIWLCFASIFVRFERRSAPILFLILGKTVQGNYILITDVGHAPWLSNQWGLLAMIIDLGQTFLKPHYTSCFKTQIFLLWRRKIQITDVGMLPDFRIDRGRGHPTIENWMEATPFLENLITSSAEKGKKMAPHKHLNLIRSHSLIAFIYHLRI